MKEILSRIPNPGASTLVDKNSYIRTVDDGPALPPPGASIQQEGVSREKASSFSDRSIALKHFKSTPLGIPGGNGEAQAYVIHIPLEKGKSVPSIVKNANVQQNNYVQETSYREKPNIKIHTIDEDFGDDKEDPVYHKEASENPISQIRQINPVNEGVITRSLNSANPNPLTDPGPGKTRLYPDSNVSSRIEAVQNRVAMKTKKPWQQFKNPYSKVAKLASAVSVDLSPYDENIWATLHIPATILDVIMTGSYGQDWISFEPETLRAEFVNSNITEENLEKLFALQVMHSNDLFWTDESVFEKICLALTGMSPDFHLRQDLNIAQITKAVYLACFVKQQEYSYEVKVHIAARAHMEGYLVLPNELKFAQEPLDKMQPECSILTDQVRTAYDKRWPAGDGEDPLSVQLRTLYAVDEFVMW